MNIGAFDHVVLTCRDAAATIAFYRDILGMTVRTFDNGRTALHFGSSKINLHSKDDGIGLLATEPTPGSLDLCFSTDASPDEIQSRLQGSGVAIIEGPVQRTGARGPMTSFYLRDPDGNLIEISTYERNGGEDIARVRRADRAVEDDTWIAEFVRRAPACVVATASGARPFVNPNLFVFDAPAKRFFFHTAGGGRTRMSIEENALVTVSIFDMGRLLPAEDILDYTVEYASVTIFGRATIVTDPALARHVFLLQMAKYFPDQQEGREWRPFTDEEAARATVYEIAIERWSGKRNRGAADHPGARRYTWDWPS
ncbi:MAG TPA: pyridoxamine 5'-phosphate oxidase family protein [Thermoanaerobaculia bacterium]|nr:pyridoxamine 5'-phosphate oxidase family protein [Thermoanaerobaculia bacterium]